MAPPAPQPKPGASGKPGGLPIWAWGAAAALGLVIGLVVFRKDSAAAAAEDSPAAQTGAAGESESAGGASAFPEDLLAALGLRTGGLPGGGGDSGGGDSGGTVSSTPAGDPAAEAMISSTQAMSAQGTNRQLPERIQVPGLGPDAPVISSYFSQPQTISDGGAAGVIYGPGNVPSIPTVQRPQEPPRLAPALAGSGVGGVGRTFAV